jgi:Meckel syndrome type 1 protein
MATPAAPPLADDTARNAQDTPAQELDKIRRLLAADRRDEARQRLADFHRDRPDYPLPDDLRTQLLTP